MTENEYHKNVQTLVLVLSLKGDGLKSASNDAFKSCYGNDKGTFAFREQNFKLSETCRTHFPSGYEVLRRQREIPKSKWMGAISDIDHSLPIERQNIFSLILVKQRPHRRAGEI